MKTKKDFAEYIVDDNEWLKGLYKEFNDSLNIFISFDTLSCYLYDNYSWEEYLDWYGETKYNYCKEITYIRSWCNFMLEELLAEYTANQDLYKKTDF